MPFPFFPLGAAAVVSMRVGKEREHWGHAAGTHDGHYLTPFIIFNLARLPRWLVDQVGAWGSLEEGSALD